MKKIIAMVIVVVMVMAFASTAFAANETLRHSGTSRYSYVSDASVPQKSDNNLYCIEADINPINAVMDVRGVIYNGGWQQVSNYLYAFGSGTNMYIPDSTSVRDVHVEIQNLGVWSGISVTTSGLWTLLP